MAEEKKRILIKSTLAPVYYKRFACIADRCQDSCCKGWAIQFNKKDYLSIKRDLEGAKGELPTEGVLHRRKKTDRPELYAEFDMTGGGCPLLNEKGLCRLQLRCGERALPEVCTEFPRGSVYLYSGFQEFSMSPACEAVLELLWDLPDGVDFVEEPLPEHKQKLVLLPDGALPAAFQEIRSFCIDLLQARRFSLSQRFLLLGLALRRAYEEAEGFDAGGWLRWCGSLLAEGAELLIPEKRADAARLALLNNVRILLTTMPPGPDFQRTKDALIDALQIKITLSPERAAQGDGFMDFERYGEAERELQRQFGNLDHFFENLMVTVFFHLKYPKVTSPEELWKSYVSFCNLYSFYRFMAVASCLTGGGRAALFHHIVYASRNLIHGRHNELRLQKEFFENESATLAHMAILVGGS